MSRIYATRDLVYRPKLPSSRILVSSLQVEFTLQSHYCGCRFAKSIAWRPSSAQSVSVPVPIKPLPLIHELRVLFPNFIDDKMWVHSVAALLPPLW
ncbi:hypothetical protein CEXT_587201 [Caerostris extrusa]|uniref:Uncharacterized protein n=1 Tax=Caerostris extrusa TaxID=172846 RepID=A0AAV4RDJ7_CAEEX|nr:hypothetical protein CEXT_587201 [Caerostris extrusa]